MKAKYIIVGLNIFYMTILMVGVSMLWPGKSSKEDTLHIKTNTDRVDVFLISYSNETPVYQVSVVSTDGTMSTSIFISKEEMVKLYKHMETFNEKGSTVTSNIR